MKLRVGQTHYSTQKGIENLRAVLEELRRLDRPVTVYELADALGIDWQSVRRSLVKAEAKKVVEKIRPKRKGQGMKRFEYALVAGAAYAETRPRGKINPFSVAAGLVVPPEGVPGVVHRLCGEPIEEEIA